MVLGHQVEIENLGRNIRGHPRGRTGRSVRKGNAGDTVALYQHLADLCLGFDHDAERLGFLAHGRRDRTHAADGVPPGARHAVEFAERMVQQSIRRAGSKGRSVVADDGIEGECGLDVVVLEPARQ